MLLRRRGVLWAFSTGIALAGLLVLGTAGPAAAFQLNANTPYYFYPDPASTCYVGIENGEYIYTAFAQLQLISGACITAGDAEVSVVAVANNLLLQGPTVIDYSFGKWGESELEYDTIVGGNYLVCDYDDPACVFWQTSPFG
jgi:hypothetical protein